MNQEPGDVPSPMRRAMRFMMFFVTALIVVDAILVVFRFLFPLYYGDTIASEASRNNLSPYLVAAVVRVESGFDPQATSGQGARGLMQVLPETGRWAGGQLGLRDFNPDQLYDPKVNIALGSWYLASLQRDFQGNLVAALAAYNAGRKNVEEWIRAGTWDGAIEGLGRVPFAETRDFVRRVRSSERTYRMLYGRTWPGDLPLDQPLPGR